MARRGAAVLPACLVFFCLFGLLGDLAGIAFVPPTSRKARTRLSASGTSEAPSGKLVATDAPGVCPTTEKLQLAMNLELIKEFLRRRGDYLGTLEDLAKFLPPDGDETKKAMGVVTTLRKMIDCASLATANAFGACYHLEDLTIMELNVLWAMGMQPTTMKCMKKNIKATLTNLRGLSKQREEAEEQLADCHRCSKVMISFMDEGGLDKVQDAVSEQCKAMEEQFGKAKAAWNEARAEAKNAAEEVAGLVGKVAEHQFRFDVYKSIAEDKKTTIRDLKRRAEERDKNAAEAEDTWANIKDASDVWWSLWGGRARDERAQWRADRYRAIAKQARGEHADHEQRMQKAVETAAAVQGCLESLKADSTAAMKRWNDALRKEEEASKELQGIKEASAALSKEYGGLQLTQVAMLRDNMQLLPRMLSDRGTEDQFMFRSIQASLDKNKQLCQRLETLLEEDDPKEFKSILASVKPFLLHAKRSADFHKDTLLSVKYSFEAVTHTLPQHMDSKPGDAGSGEGTFSMQDDDEDDPL